MPVALWPGVNDLRYALRQFLRNPGFTMVAALTLALGIGGTTAIFSVVNAVILKPLPYDQPGQLVQIWEAPRPGGRNSVSPGGFMDWNREATLFACMAHVGDALMNLTGSGEPERINGIQMSGAGLETLRARPILGRIFEPGEDVAGRDHVVVLTEEFWKRRFGSDPAIVGKSIELNTISHTVIGILPPQFLPWKYADFVLPRNFQGKEAEERGSHWLRVIARLKPGVSIEQAQAELTSIRERLKPLYPAFKKDWGVTIIPLHEEITGEIRPTLLLLLGAVACVLLIACSNVANLLLAKGSARRKEITIRLALGAARGRIVRQLLTESVLLAFVGATIGVLLALWITSGIAQIPGLELPRADEIAIDWRVLTFAVALAAFTGIAFGILPAWHSARTDLNESLKEGARGTSAQGGRVRSSLIVTEVAIALLLLIGAGLLLNSFYRISNVAPGFDPQKAIALQISLTGARYSTAAARTRFIEAALDRIERLPGVQAAGFSSNLPIADWPWDTAFLISGAPSGPVGGYQIDFDFVSGDYFRAMGIPVLRGRVFSEREALSEPKVVIVNDALARKYFPKGDAVGKRIHLDTLSGKIDQGWEIVGVVGDIRRRSLTSSVQPCVWRPFAHTFSENTTLILRTAGEPTAVIDSVRKAIAAIDPNQPIANIRPLATVIHESIAQQRFLLLLLGGFAGVALLLAAIGLYGVISYGVTQRTREIGVRMALGADPIAVVRMILRQALRLAGVGVLIGLASGLGLTRLLQKLLYNVEPTDPMTFATVAALLILVAVIAAWLPARRASKIHPVEALRAE